MKATSKKYLISALCLLISSCDENRDTFKIKVSAKRADGASIALASVHLDGEPLGETNAFGTLDASKALRVDEQHTVTVTHEDPSYYYSPYSQKFQFTHNDHKQINIDAVMFLAPKPKNLKTEPKIISVDKKNSPQTGAESFLTDLATPRLSLLDLNLRDFKAEKNNNKLEHQPIDEDIVSIHVHSGHAALSNATVMLAGGDGQITQCFTNERGRCALRAKRTKANTASVLVRKKGFESQIGNVIFGETQNIRMNLKPGFTLDIRVMSSKNTKLSPAPSISLVSEQGVTVQSDQQGLAVIPAAKRDLIHLTLKSGEKGTPLNVRSALTSEDLINLRLPSTDQATSPQFVVHHVHTRDGDTFAAADNLLENIVTSIKSEVGAEISEGFSVDPDQLNVGQFALLPILGNTDQGPTLSIMMIEKDQGTIISEKIGASDLNKIGLNNAIKNLLSQLQKRRPRVGVVEHIEGDHILIRSENTNVNPGESVAIKLDNKMIAAQITKVNKNQITAKIANSDLLETWRLLGALTFTQPIQDSKGLQLEPLLQSLHPKPASLQPLDLALKYLRELNPKQALLSLEKLEISTPAIEIMKLYQDARGQLQLGNTSQAASRLYRALALAEEHQYQDPIYIVSASLNLLKSELLPDFGPDRDLANTLSEFLSENRSLLEQIDSRSARIKSLKPTLEYANLLLSQKLAVASGDALTLSKLTQRWETFEQSLQGLELSDEQRLQFARSGLKARQRNFPKDNSAKAHF